MKVSYSDYTNWSAAKSDLASVMHAAMEEESVSDTQLWCDFRKGSESAYALIYKRNMHDMYHYGLSLYNNPSFIKDCIHDIFVEIWQSRSKLAEVRSIKPYLLSAIRNKVNKKHRRSNLGQFFFNLVSQQGKENSVETNLILQHEEEEQQSRLQDAIKQLSSRQREVIFLKFYQGLSYEEIAGILSITVKGAYKLTGRAVHVLRKNMLIWLQLLIGLL